MRGKHPGANQGVGEKGEFIVMTGKLEKQCPGKGSYTGNPEYGAIQNQGRQEHGKR